MGRELRRRRRLQRHRHPPRAGGRRNGHVLLLARDELDHRGREQPDRHRSRRFPERARTARAIGIRAACARGCRTPTATARSPSAPMRCRRARTRRRPRSIAAWDENYGAGGIFNGTDIGFTVADGDTVTFSFVSSTNVLTVSNDGPGQHRHRAGRRAARYQAPSRPVSRRVGVLRDDRPLRRRRPDERHRRARRRQVRQRLRPDRQGVPPRR